VLHPFVIPTGIVNIIKIVDFWGVGDVEIREIVRSCLWAEFVENVQIEFDSTTDMDRVRPLHISESAIRQPVDDLPICLEDFSGEGGAHVDRWSEVVTEDRVVIGECHWLVTEHDPVIESEFTELADIGRLTRHHPFWNLPLQDKDIVCSFGANVSLELDRI